MNAQDTITLRGSLEILLMDAKGNEIERQHVKNTVVTVGRKWVLQQINSSQIQTNQSIGYIAVGTSTTVPTTGDSGLGSEVLRKAINNFTTSNETSNPPSWQAEVSFATNEANTTLGEFGLFNSSAAGTMFARAVFATTLNKTTSNTLAMSYAITG